MLTITWELILTNYYRPIIEKKDTNSKFVHVGQMKLYAIQKNLS